MKVAGYRRRALPQLLNPLGLSSRVRYYFAYNFYYYDFDEDHAPRVWENRSIVGSIPDDAVIIPACAGKISFTMLVWYSEDTKR